MNPVYELENGARYLVLKIYFKAILAILKTVRTLFVPLEIARIPRYFYWIIAWKRRAATNGMVLLEANYAK